jgi:hypothetical protein
MVVAYNANCDSDVLETLSGMILPAFKMRLVMAEQPAQ